MALEDFIAVKKCPGCGLLNYLSDPHKFDESYCASCGSQLEEAPNEYDYTTNASKYRKARLVSDEGSENWEENDEYEDEQEVDEEDKALLEKIATPMRNTPLCRYIFENANSGATILAERAGAMEYQSIVTRKLLKYTFLREKWKEADTGEEFYLRGLEVTDGVLTKRYVPIPNGFLNIRYSSGRVVFALLHDDGCTDALTDVVFFPFQSDEAWVADMIYSELGFMGTFMTYGPVEDGDDDEDNEDELLSASTPASSSAVRLGVGINQKTEREEIVAIGDVERRSGVYILGKPGMGKTTLLVNMIVQDIEHGHGLCFLDPHGDAIEEVLKRLPDKRKGGVIFIDPLNKTSAIGLNLYQCLDPHDDREVSQTVNYVMAIFAKLFADGDLSKMPQMAQVLRNTTLTLIENPGMTMAEIPLLLEIEEARAKLIKNVTNPQVRLFWTRYNRMKQNEQQQFTASTVNKLDEFLTLPFLQYIVGQSTTTINFREVMDTGKILLVKLSREQSQLTTLVGSFIIGQLLHAVYSRDSIPEGERRHFCLYCDEFQNFATPDFAKLITEGRKYRIATTIAHQERASQFEKEDKNRGATLAAANMVLFQTTVTDAKELAPEFARQPQAAWEEEIEPESHERIEEQITDDVEEEVQAPVPNPVDYLKHHPHGNPEVDQVIRETLLPIFAEFREDKHAYVFYPHMPEQNPFFVTYRTNYIQAEQVLHKLLTGAMMKTLNSSLSSNAPNSVTVLFAELLSLLRGYFMCGSDKGSSGDQEFYKGCIRYLLRETMQSFPIEERLADIWEDCYGRDARMSKDWATSRMSSYRYKFTEETKRELPAFIKQTIAKARQTFEELLELITLLKTDPILVSTGQRRLVPRKRTQVHYIAHPRQTIIHQQRTIADMVNEMEQELSNLPRFTAYCKIVRESGGKQIVAKYRFNPDNLRQSDNASIVEQRKQGILFNTVRLGYVTDREAVKQQIAARQNELLRKEQKRAQTTTDEDEN